MTPTDKTVMGSNLCRVCGGALFREPLLAFKNMPKAAQHLPDATTVDKDHGCDLDIFQCSRCGLVQLHNEPVPYWREVIRATAFSQEMGEFRKEQFKAFVEQYGLSGKKIVEIGCGKGEYLSLMQDAGARVTGTEFSEASASHCIHAGMRVERLFVEGPEIRLRDAPFDAFFILNFLEHLADPNSTLQGISANLADNAIGLIEVPNFDMILKKKLFSEFIADHLFYFTRETLNALLERNGFEVIETREIWHDYILSAVVRKRRPIDLSAFRQQQALLKSELTRFVASFGKKNVAVWGAGHQALAVLALADLGGTIKYVVDSAPFKQGRLTPSTHIPIVPPETLTTDPVAAVLIMAAAYSNEVASIIRKSFGAQIVIAILRDDTLEAVN
jgi:2-polyprenyl-3-methyl-5-hydroxy-6-metoxy-1,4-benzoquinol methylase